MHANVTVTADELAVPVVRPDAKPSAKGGTLVWLGGWTSGVATWVSAADARRIADAWRQVAGTLAGVEFERTLPTLAEVTADRDAAEAEVTP